MKSSYEVRAQKFIRKFYSYITEWYDGGWDLVDVIAEAVDAFNQECHRAVKCRNGFSRIALVTSDYVVKIDYHTNDWVGNCEREMRLYQKAEADGFEYLLAKISRYDYCGHSFYIMPRVRGVGDIRRSKGWEADFFLSDEENDWLAEHGIGDLHWENYGWEDNRPLIVDYAAMPAGYYTDTPE